MGLRGLGLEKREFIRKVFFFFFNIIYTGQVRARYA